MVNILVSSLMAENDPNVLPAKSIKLWFYQKGLERLFQIEYEWFRKAGGFHARNTVPGML